VTAFDGLRLTLVGPLPPPAGGMANQTRQLAELLRGAGVRVQIVQSNAPYRPAWVGRVPVGRALFRLLPFMWALWRSAGSSDLFHIMANSGWSWHLFAAPAIRIAALRGVPVVVNYRGGEAATFLARSHGRVRATLAFASALIVPSGYLREVFARHGIESEVVPNIVDLDRFHPASPPGPRAARLVVARNLELIYDNATALRAFALVRRRHPTALLTIAGTGPELAPLQALGKELGVSDGVRFPGRLDRDAMAALYREADVMLNPSTVDNMPNSVLEAMASAVPVVSTDVGGVPYIVHDGTTALLVKPGDASAMAAATLRLLDNSDLAATLAAAGVEEVRRYTWSKVQGVLSACYSRVLDARGAHGQDH
jgi:glycosyltransferase involved in cell wall biosynthesis